MSDALKHLAGVAAKHQGLYDEIARSHPSLLRGQVICLRCMKTRTVDPAKCLREGWPKCCGATMSIDSPKEAKR